MRVRSKTLTFGIRMTELTEMSCVPRYTCIRATETTRSVYEFADKVLLSRAVMSAQISPAKVWRRSIRLLFGQRHGNRPTAQRVSAASLCLSHVHPP